MSDESNPPRRPGDRTDGARGPLPTQGAASVERPEAKRARHFVQHFSRRRLAHKIIGLEKQLVEARVRIRALEEALDPDGERWATEARQSVADGSVWQRIAEQPPVSEFARDYLGPDAS